MFKYISEILSKLSMGQRLLALVFLLLSITFISVGPKIVNDFTQDNEELKTKVELQRSEIIELTQRVEQLNNQVITDQESCTDRFAKREQQFLVMISSLEAEAQKTNGRVTVMEEKHHVEAYDGGTGGANPKVAMMQRPEPFVQAKTVIKTDNSTLLKMIKDMKKNFKGGN